MTRVYKTQPLIVIWLEWRFSQSFQVPSNQSHGIHVANTFPLISLDH